MKWIFSKYLPNGSQSEKNVAYFFHVHDGDFFNPYRTNVENRVSS